MKILMVTTLIAGMMLSFASAEDTGAIHMNNLEVKLNFSQVPTDYTCDGRNVSPRIEVHGLDPSAKSLAVIIEDMDVPSGTFTHWAIWNMEPTDQIPEGLPNDPQLIKPIKAVQGGNSGGRVGYMGPCPPKGKPHRYFFRVYGLDAMLNLRPGASSSDLQKAMAGHIVQQGEAMATYQRRGS
ncbi:MAG TPA: YbhB/YbcL family Raf kinase inhibitor-like protein [Methanotrichaceae archaeon]|nr:YbhB/YbcL family Raf kinase inhibitor-like protein [Methanotrichaceae archaeon]